MWPWRVKPCNLAHPSWQNTKMEQFFFYSGGSHGQLSPWIKTQVWGHCVALLCFLKMAQYKIVGVGSSKIICLHAATAAFLCRTLRFKRTFGNNYQITGKKKKASAWPFWWRVVLGFGSWSSQMCSKRHTCSLEENMVASPVFLTLTPLLKKKTWKCISHIIQWTRHSSNPS